MCVRWRAHFVCSIQNRDLQTLTKEATRASRGASTRAPAACGLRDRVDASPKAPLAIDLRSSPHGDGPRAKRTPTVVSSNHLRLLSSPRHPVHPSLSLVLKPLPTSPPPPPPPSPHPAACCRRSATPSRSGSRRRASSLCITCLPTLYSRLRLFFFSARRFSAALLASTGFCFFSSGSPSASSPLEPSAVPPPFLPLLACTCRRENARARV